MIYNINDADAVVNIESADAVVNIESADTVNITAAKSVNLGGFIGVGEDEQA